MYFYSNHFFYFLYFYFIFKINRNILNTSIVILLYIDNIIILKTNGGGECEI